MMQILRRWGTTSLLLLAMAVPAAAQSTGDIDGTRLTHLVDVDGAAQASLTITGTFSGTITFKVQHRNRAPVVVDCFTPAAPASAVNSTTGTGSWSCPVAGFHFLEVQFSSYSSGTATILADTSSGGPALVAAAGGGGGGDNAAAGATAAAVPDFASYTGVNVGGNLVGQTGVTAGSATGAAVAIIDGSGNHVTSFGGGTQYAEGATAATITGTAMLMEGAANALVPAQGTAADGLLVNLGANNDVTVTGTVTVGSHAVTNAGTFATQVDGAALTALQLIDNIPITIGSTTSGQSGALAMGAVTTSAPTYTTAQSHPLSLDTTGSLRVAITSGAGSGGTALADDADFTAGTTSFTPFGGFYQSTVTACTDGDACAARITAGRAVTMALVNPDGSAATYATDVVEDAAETAGGGGPMVLSVRRDTAASSAGSAGDNATFNTDSLGRLWVRPGNPCEDHARVQSAAISNSTSGNVEVVALNGSDLIYVCGYSLVAGAATGVRFVYGTGTACATGETGLTGAWSFAANGGISQPNGGAPQFVVPAGNAFCTENTGANAIAGHVTYVRTAAP